MRARVIVGADLDYSPGSRLEHELRTTRDGKVFTGYEVLDAVYDYDVTFRSASPYVQAEASPGERMRVVAGLRYDLMGFEYHSRLTPQDVGRHRRPGDATVTYSHLSPKLGMTYELGRSANLFASYGHGFRAPSEGQLFRQGQALSTVDLEPVKVDSYEAGVRGAVGRLVEYDLAVYTMTKYDDVLAYTNPDGTRETVNAGETRHRGVELGIGAQLGRELRAEGSFSRASHSYVVWRPRPHVDLGGKTMETAPRDIGNVVISYAPRAWAGSRFAAEWSHLGGYWMDAENTHRYDGHRLFNLRAHLPMTAEVTVFGRLMNVGNTRFAESAGYTAARGEEYAPGLPRTLYVGVSYTAAGR
jgi:iron complex outermembrane recepter protein